jgi:hypothetical protein
LITLAVVLCVALPVAGFLVAWRWWLRHLEAERAARTRSIDVELAKVVAFEKQLLEMNDKLQHQERVIRSLEIKTAGRG